MRKFIETEVRSAEFSIERMTEFDLAQVVELEELTGLSRWGLIAYDRELRENSSAIMLVARPRLLAGESGPVIGFLCSNVVLDEWHINNVATHPDHRRRGVAWELIEQGRELAVRTGAVFGLLEVRATNHAAQLLYQKLGFRIMGRRPCYYAHPSEDAIVLRMGLRDTARGEGG